jgi:exopolysaccharide biosynthesis polyprenyl glycosylphosphotransferase
MTPETSIELPLREDETVTELGAVGMRPTLVVEPMPELRTLAPSQPVTDHRATSVAWRESLNRRLLACADIIAASIALVVLLNVFGQRRVAAMALVGIALLLFLFKASGLYDRDDLRLVHSTLEEIPLLAQLTGLFALGVAILQSIVLAGGLSADKIAALWLASLLTIVCGRVIARAVAGHTSPLERCLIIGEAAQVGRIRAKLAASRARAEVVASLPLTTEELPLAEWIGIPKVMRRIVAEHDVHRIIIAPAAADTRPVVDVIRVAKSVGVRVSLLPRMFEVVGSAVEFDDVDGLTMLGLPRFGLSRSSRALKRTFDVAAGGVALLVVSPVLLAIAIAIRLDSRGPILFRQVRVGREGSHFRIVKYRSMAVGADARKDELRSINEAGDGLFKIAQDPRVTRIGRLLRATSLDELPQLWNVLRGEMSLVGPRPLVIDEDAQVLGLDRSRLHLTPGMTGPWQVLGSRVPMQEMVALDYLYVANWTLWLDMKVLVRTVRHVVRRGNR